MIIRKAVFGDIDELIRLGSQWLTPFWNEKEKRKILRQRLRRKRQRHPIYVVKLGLYNKLIAFCDIWVHNDWLTNKKRMLILHVYVSKGWRRKGIGTQLLRYVLSDVKPDFAVVDTKTNVAKRLYKKVGFKINPRRIWLEQ